MRRLHAGVKEDQTKGLAASSLSGLVVAQTPRARELERGDIE